MRHFQLINFSLFLQENEDIDLALAQLGLSEERVCKIHFLVYLLKMIDFSRSRPILRLIAWKKLRMFN